MFYIIAYDIPSDKPGTRRRTKLAKLLDGYGDRVQGSVFECIIESSKIFETMKEEIEYIVNEKEDSVRIYRLKKAYEEVTIIGKGEITEIEDFLIV